MPVNAILLDGVCERPALRYDDQGKVEFRWTMRQASGDWSLFVPCCASGAAVERLLGEMAEGDTILLTSAKLCWRKRATKGGVEQSRMEVLVWQVEQLSELAHVQSSQGGEEVTAVMNLRSLQRRCRR